MLDSFLDGAASTGSRTIISTFIYTILDYKSYKAITYVNTGDKNDPKSDAGHYD